MGLHQAHDLVVDDQAVGNPARRDARRAFLYGEWLEAAKADDFVGVQAYSRTRLDENGAPTGPEAGVELVSSMGYEFWPDALEVSIRHAAEVAGSPAKKGATCSNAKA